MFGADRRAGRIRRRVIQTSFTSPLRRAFFAPAFSCLRFAQRTGVNAIGGWAGKGEAQCGIQWERVSEGVARAARGGTGVDAVAEPGQTYCQTVRFCCQKTMFRVFQSMEHGFFLATPWKPACFLPFLFFYLLVFQCSNVPRKTQQIPKNIFYSTRGSSQFLCGLNRSLGLAA